MLYLVLRSRFHARLERNDAATPEAENVTIRNIMAGVGTTVFQFFKAMTKVLELAGREKWLTDLVPNRPVFVNEFKQVEVKFMFVYMLHEKLKKVPRSAHMPRLPFLSPALFLATAHSLAVTPASAYSCHLAIDTKGLPCHLPFLSEDPGISGD